MQLSYFFNMLLNNQKLLLEAGVLSSNMQRLFVAHINLKLHFLDPKIKRILLLPELVLVKYQFVCHLCLFSKIVLLNLTVELTQLIKLVLFVADGALLHPQLRLQELIFSYQLCNLSSQTICVKLFKCDKRSFVTRTLAKSAPIYNILATRAIVLIA